MSIAQFAGASTAFPLKAVTDCIEAALADQAGTQSVLQGNLAKVSTPGSWEPEIDSLVTVELICAIEEQLGVTLPQTFIPRGGYASKAECVADLVQQTKAVWEASVAQETVDA